jgi:cytochrome P450
VFAGSDTTATTLAFALLELSRHPDALARCAAEVDAAMGDRPAGAGARTRAAVGARRFDFTCSRQRAAAAGARLAAAPPRRAPARARGGLRQPLCPARLWAPLRAARRAVAQAHCCGSHPALQDTIPAEEYQRMPLLAGVASETLRMYPAAVSISRRAAQVRCGGRRLLSEQRPRSCPPKLSLPRARGVLYVEAACPPLTGAAHRAPCPQDTTLGGSFVPSGTRVAASVFALQRHEDFWPQPDV